MPGTCGSARYTRQIFDDFEHVTLRAGDATRLVSVHFGGHDLLGERGRDDHDLEIISVGFSVLFWGIELDFVRRIDLLAGLEALFTL